MSVSVTLPGPQGIRTFEVSLDDLPEDKFKGLVVEAIVQSFPYVQDPIDCNLYTVLLEKYPGMATIGCTKDLVDAIDNSDQRSIHVAAYVNRKADPGTQQPAYNKKRKATNVSGPAPARKQKIQGKATGQEKVHLGLANLKALGITEPTRSLLFRWSRYETPTNANKGWSGFEKTLSNMKKSGSVWFPSRGGKTGTVSLTDLEAPHVSPPTTTKERHERIKTFLKPKEVLFYEHIQDGRVYSCMDVALALGYNLEKLSGFEKLRSSLSSAGWIRYDSKAKTVQLTEICFVNPSEVVVVD